VTAANTEMGKTDEDIKRQVYATLQHLTSLHNACWMPGFTAESAYLDI